MSTGVRAGPVPVDAAVGEAVRDLGAADALAFPAAEFFAALLFQFALGVAPFEEEAASEANADDGGQVVPLGDGGPEASQEGGVGRSEGFSNVGQRG